MITLISAFLLTSVLLAAQPAVAEGIANVQFEATVPAPLLGNAFSLSARNVLVVDEEARFTFFPDVGATEQAWTAPATGLLAAVDPALGEVLPVPKGVAVTPDGSYWAGTIAYEEQFPGRLYGFAQWNDEPIWTYTMPAPAQTEDADQPTALAAGGPYYALGTTTGKVHLITARDTNGAVKTPSRTFTEDNQGNDFGKINDVALSADGKRVLIGTDDSGKSSVHLFSDTFFVATFKRMDVPALDVEISADATRGAVVTGTGNGARVHFLDLTTGTTLWETTLGSTVTSLAISKTGRTLAAGTENGQVWLFVDRGLFTDRNTHQLYSLGSKVTGLGVSNDGMSLAAATESGKAFFMDRDRKAPLWTHDAGSPLVGAALSGDAETLVLTGKTADTGRVIYSAADHQVSHLVPPEPRLAPGVLNQIPIELANNGNRMETISVAWKELPTRWDGRAANITLAPGEKGTLNAPLYVAKAQAPNTYTVPFDIVAATIRIPVTLTVRVPEVTSGQASAPWSLDLAVAGGAPAAYLIHLENTGNTANDAAVGYAKLPPGWRAEFLGSAEFHLQPGEDRLIALKVWADKDARTGSSVPFDVIVAWTHGEERLPLTVQVVNSATYYELLTKQIDNPEKPTNGGDLTDQLLKDAQQDFEEHIRRKNAKDSPGAGLIATLAALGAVLAVWRRRQKA